MNFRVTCIDSGRTQRASGANPRTPSMKTLQTLTDGIVDIESDKNRSEVVSLQSSVFRTSWTAERLSASGCC